MGYYADENYAVYNERHTKARKAHSCGACEETIQPAHTYWNVSMVFNGRAWSIKRCERCQAIHEHLRELLEGQEAWPEENLDCGMDYEDKHGAMPDDVAALAFVTQDEMQRIANA